MKAFIRARRPEDNGSNGWIVCWLRFGGEWWLKHWNGQWLMKGCRKPASYGTRHSPFPDPWKRCSQREYRKLNRERTNYFANLN